MKIELDLTNYGFINDMGYLWLHYDYLETEGNTLAELLDNAIVFTCDKHGGSCGYAELCDTKYYEEIESLIRLEYTKREKINGRHNCTSDIAVNN